MGDPTTITENATGTVAGKDPCKLSPAGPDEGLKDWKKLLNHTPPPDVKSDLKTRFGNETRLGLGPSKPHIYHHITDGTGECNFDFYALQIFSMPTYVDQSANVPMDRKRVPYDKKGLLEKIRKELHIHMDTSIAKFLQYSASDGSKWNSSSPLKAVMKFHMVALEKKVMEETGKEGSVAAGVVCSEITDDHWIFTTTWTKDTGDHPVNGYRQFGLAVLKPSETLPSRYCGVSFANRDKDVLYFYTRGVDRRSSSVPFNNAPDDMVFGGGHRCWKGFIARVMIWIQQEGGSCASSGFVSKREDWDKIKKSTVWDKGSP